MALNALLGQPRATTLLGGALASGRVHHAYLFAGPPGVGKTLAAELVARALNCESPAAQEAARQGRFVDSPCGECAACRRISENPKQNAHPLVMWIDTEATMQAQGLYSPDGERTAAKAIGVRLLRELVIPRVALTVIGGRRKVVIFRDVDFTEGAQNAFLKTLEEPPPETTFIILSSTPDSLKQTIRSRCLRVVFAPLPLEIVAERVAKARKLDREQAALCAAVAGGNLGLALAIDPKALQKRRDLILLWERLGPNDWSGWLSFAAALDERESAIEALEVLETWLHDISIAAASGLPPVTNLDLAEQAAAAGQRLGTAETIRRLELVRKTRVHIEQNAAPRLQMERMVLELNGITALTLAPEAA
jgi:DNA polymerase-3 subunit delta'